MATKAATKQPAKAKKTAPKAEHKANKKPAATSRISYARNRKVTPMLKPADVQKEWVMIDAEGVVLGRLAAFIAHKLRGKDKPAFTPSTDCGDNVVVINAAKVAMTRNKLDDEKYYYHTGFPGGIKERTRSTMLRGKNPSRVVYLAVQRMMPRGPLGRLQMTHLRIYPAAEHPHAAQQPTMVAFGTVNPKNKLR